MSTENTTQSTIKESIRLRDLHKLSNDITNWRAYLSMLFKRHGRLSHPAVVQASRILNQLLLEAYQYGMVESVEMTPAQRKGKAES